MKNTQFWLGLALGVSLSMVLSMGIFYCYVVKEIESTKNETRKEIQALKDFWNSEFREDFKQLKESVLESAYERLKNFQKKREEQKIDSTGK